MDVDAFAEYLSSKGGMSYMEVAIEKLLILLSGKG